MERYGFLWGLSAKKLDGEQSEDSKRIERGNSDPREGEVQTSGEEIENNKSGEGYVSEQNERGNSDSAEKEGVQCEQKGGGRER